MKIFKLADRYTATDLTDHLLACAKELGMIEKFMAKTPLIRGYTRLLKAFDKDSCLLVLVTEYLLKGGFVQEVGVTEKLLTVSVFDIAARQMGGLVQPWRYNYFKRFAENLEEARFFRLWLSRYEDSRVAPGDSPARIGEQLYPSWKALGDDALDRLEKATKVIAQRCEERGVEALEWREPAPERPEFLMDPNRPTLIPKRRRKDAPDTE